MSDNFLVVGADGLLGAALFQAWRDAAVPVTGTSRRKEREHLGYRYFDLTDFVEPPLPRASVAVICAGISDLKSCSREYESTRHVNVTQTIKLTRMLAAAGCFTVLLSSNQVFDGSHPWPKISDPTTPRTAYGVQKVEMEEALGDLMNSTAIIRLTKVFHPKMSLVERWRETLRAGGPVVAFSDYICSPVPVHLVVQCIARIAVGRRAGLWHVSGRDNVSYWDVAQLLARTWNADPHQVQSSSGRSAGLEHLPRYASLDASATEDELRIRMPTAENVLTELFCTD